MKKLVAILALACGCAGLPERPQAPPSNPTVEPATTRPAPREVRSLTLEQALTLAETMHPELAAAQARLRAAEGRVLQAGLLPNPGIVARAERVTDHEEYLAGVGMTVPLGGRLAAAVAVEERDRERLAHEAAAEKLEVRARVHAAFAAALHADEARRLQAEALKDAQSAVTVARARLAAGEGLPEETARAEMEELRARLELERAVGLRDRGRLALAAAIGDPGLAVVDLEGAIEAALEIPSLESALKRLPDSPLLSAAEAEAATRRELVRLAEAERIPDVSVELLYRREHDAGVNTFDMGLGITLPLFNRNQGRLQEARADVSLAEARVRAVGNDVERQIRDGHARLTRALAQARFLREEMLPRAGTVLAGFEKRYAAGDISLADVLPVRRDRLQLRLTYLEMLRDVTEAWSDLKRILPDAK